MNAARFAANIGWLFTEVPIERRFEAAAAAGFTAVEHAQPYSMPLSRWRALLDAAGLRLVLVNTPVGEPGSPAATGWGCLPEQAGQFRVSVERALDYAVALDRPLVQLRAGVLPPGVSRDAALTCFIANAHWAAERAAEAGVRLTVEALNPRDAPGYLIDTQELAAAVVAAVGHRHLGVQFDVYHCQVAQGDLTTRLTALREVIAHVQIADAPGRAEPGSGEIRFQHVLSTLGELGYEGWIGCEYRPAAGTVAGLGWRERIGGLP
ncbi:hydroxypyruvate isomerase family protein [Amycolatopsis magusensis]|uniref:Hydroxypyruvate isomerase n=1 Tax=Amycolatopsis magusensis TaxID=882444 RepID=A0ABS4PW20_9PSEU|nr:TIM barrel protein [Amycolatopsis magusensis]MBP2183629.1 hydroxypyruvate isomerase [Amycolatopsis magusensis]MDI5976751.1 TIM barrel protein [Amycolatopsis magusensis]